MASGDLTNIRYSDSSIMTFTKMSSGKFVDSGGTSHNVSKIYFAPSTDSSDLKLIWQKAENKTFTYVSLDANFAIYDSDTNNTTFQFISDIDITTYSNHSLRYFNSSIPWTSWLHSTYTAPSDLGDATASLTVTSVTVNGASAYLYSVPKITNSNTLGIGANISTKWGSFVTVKVFTKTQLTNVGFSLCSSPNFGNDIVYTGSWYNWMDFTAQTGTPIRYSDL
jgi:hypothetical protein